MKNNKFCHLHVHNEFSYLDGMGTSKQYVKRAKELGFTHLALTNHGNIDGLIQFQKICDETGIKPIMGCEMYIVPKIMEKNKGEQRGHITILIKNEKGWKSLCSMLTKANLEGFYYKPRIDFDMLLSSELSGLVILTGCSKSFLYNELGEAFLWSLFEKIRDVYIEIMPHILDDNTAKEYDISHSSKFHNKRLLEFSMKYGLRMCATNDVHYVNKDDYETQEVLLAIQTKAKWNDSKRWKFSEKGLYLRTANEMLDAFNKQADFNRDIIWKAMRNTMKIAQVCESFRIPKYDISLPEVKKPKIHESISDSYYLNQICIDLLSKMLEVLPMKKYKKYQKRLQYELKIISNKKFARYFLIVRDLIRWCKKNNIMVGPGRGSVGGSLVAYLLGITTIDPIKYGLLFSRFISKNRIDFPDIDMDFEDSKRGLIKEYLENKYGKDNIVGISTFLTMKGKAVIRDVARVFDVPLSDVGQFTKSFKIDDESESSLKDGLSEFEGKRFQKKYPKIIKHALKLEGQIRGVGSHAAAIVVSPVSLIDSDRGNLCIRGAENKSIVINWEMDFVDYVGLMKLDILGLNTLTILNEMKKIIPKDENIHFNKLIPKHEEVFKELSEGKTVGIFQFSTPLLTEMSKKMKISNFNDMVAALALVRPGPLESGMTDDYLKRKLNGEWEKKHPIYEKITKDTYGVVIYQEQVMQVINKVAGLSYSTADEIRKVIGKKRHSSEFEPYRKKFIKGCLKQKTFSKQEAKWFWEMILKCARYLFNKSHAVEYAMLAYWTGWAKLHYPYEFISACLSYGGEKKKSEYVKEAQRLGLTIKLPKVGISDAFKWKIKFNDIYVPFIEIKGIGEKTALECCRGEEKVGFFTLQPQMKGKIGKILNEIGAYDINSNPKDVGKYFSFGIDCGISIKKQSFKGYKEKLLDCKKCGLRKECSKPVMPSIGKYNVVILGEAPGREENLRGIPFIGRAGDLLMNELKKHGLQRNLFHITNTVKCFVNPNIKITTLDGLKNISEIQIGDMVLTHKGRFKPVIWIRPNDRLKRRSKLIKITIKINESYNRGKKVFLVTPEHPFLTSGLQWVEAENILIGDKLKCLAKQCLNCGVLIASIKKSNFCCRKCSSIYWNKNKICNKKKKSRSMKNLYKKGVLNGEKMTRKAHIKTRKLVRLGKHHLLSKNRTVICRWKGKTKWEDKSLFIGSQKSFKTNLKSGHIDKLKYLGMKALKKYYLTHERTFKSKHSGTRIENIVAWALKKKGYLDFTQNKYLYGFYPDIYFEKSKIIIECDGKMFHSTQKQIKKDTERDKKLESHGYSILRFKEKEIKKDVFACIDKFERLLKNHLGKYKFTDVKVISIKQIITDGRKLYNFGVQDDESYIADGVVSHNCFPSKTKTPQKEHVSMCLGWLRSELEQLQCSLVLSLGATSLYALTGKEGGILSLNGKMEYNDKLKCNIFYCLHPAAVLRDPNKQEMFSSAIKSFAKVVKENINEKPK